ncbi:glycosyl transferase family 1 [Stutzerimonas zhaodongensis]|uniref:Glycosyl transferase family 1 n=1 Tax=Stutzerimonas zhaodongensis TaxID=1176257 RepID=A0A365PQ10_9GAMM|nr:glycosyltransferase [Stutzerimonas zhaodongensis]RBA52995.1 glycosyl transferase family 1 [Stutzerimonas zhaodongensis]
MHLIICNERLLFRFGVDRVLLLLAQGLKNAGWRITFIAQRADPEVLRRISDDVHIVSIDEAPGIDSDRATAAWLRANRHRLLPAGSAPAGTVALLGGWPFYSAISVFREWGIAPVALDCGGVPYASMQGMARRTQELLRSRRREFFPEASAITPISHFIERTQSRPDAGPAPQAQITTIHLGADHLAAPEQLLWRSGAADASVNAVSLDQGTFILNLGRWETGNYKNSEALFTIARSLLAERRELRFGVLASADELDVPDDLKPCIQALGHPDDAELAQLMAESALGLSVSRWEGFNLPLAEMQQLGKPVLVLDLGAHPEVVASADQLCIDEPELATKAAAVLDGQLLAGPAWQAALEAFRQTFTWQRTVARYAALLEGLQPPHEPNFPRVVVDAGACLRDPANTGVARVVRSLCRKLQDLGEPLFVAWDEQLNTYVLPTEAEYRTLGAYGGPDPEPAHYRLPCSPPGLRLTLPALVGRRLQGAWLLQGEIIFERQGPRRRQAARELGMRVAAIFHDAIPVSHPQWVLDDAIRDNHASYMTGLADCDQVLAVSAYSARQLESFWHQRGIGGRRPVLTCVNPGELTGAARAVEPPVPPLPDEPLRLLCVSTLEPRKNHRTLLAAVALLAEQQPQLDWRLDLVGNRYAGAAELAAEVANAAAADPRIVWHGVVDDADLNRLYASAHLTIYPSLVEGFGMPILESLWHGRPCLCHQDGVMAELAQAGGCQTTDMHDPAALAATLAELAATPARYRLLAEQAITRPILTWRGHARTLLSQLATHDLHRQPVSAPFPRHWQHLMVPEGQPLTGEPAQLALACLLRQRPSDCALLFGEQPEWLLRLVGQLVPQAWQLKATGDAQSLLRQSGVSRIVAPPADGLTLLRPELLKQGVQPGLLVVGDEALADSALIQALAQLLHTSSVPCLLLLPADGAAAISDALDLPAEPHIELPGFDGYGFGLTGGRAG